MKFNPDSIAIVFVIMLVSCAGDTSFVNEKESGSNVIPDNSQNRTSARENKDVRLPVISSSGSGADIEWKQVEEREKLEIGGPGFFYNDCSQGYISPIGCSSTLTPQGKSSYELDHLIDGNPMSAWVEGSSVEAGQSFEVKAININVIYNGYQSSISSFYNNARVKKFKIYMDAKPMCYLLLEDKMQGQNFQLPFEWKFEEMHTFRFEIVETYPGKKWEDVGISELDFVLCCVAEGTEVMAASGQKLPVQSITEGTAIMSMDVERLSAQTSNVTSFAEQWHNNLLEVKTAHHSVLATADHPFVSEHYGAISMYRLKFTAGLDSYADLPEAEESLLVYDDKTQRYVYEKIVSVSQVPGNFKTYAVKGLTFGGYYVAGGFVTPVDERGVSEPLMRQAFYHLNSL